MRAGTPTTSFSRLRDRVSGPRLAWLAGGVLALVAGTALGWNAALLDAVARPPALVRAALVAGSVVFGLTLLGNAIRRVEGAVPRDSSSPGDRYLPGLIRGVRLVFLGVAAFAAAGGWLLGHPLPFVVALVIAGIDVLETSFLLLVVTLQRDT